MGIVEFLTARLDEDEAFAERATAGPWLHDPSKQWQDPGANQLHGQECVIYGRPPRANSPAAFGPPLDSGGCIATTGPADDLPSMADAAHIARHDPARVLREVAAKRHLLRRVVGLRKSELASLDETEWLFRLDGDGYQLDYLAALALKTLAAAYADHPDYDLAWKVEQ